jgi:putative pyruvate formate lyase activating enzyme
MTLLNYFSVLSGRNKPKYLSADMDSLIKRCNKIAGSCTLCEHRCGVDRLKDELGICGVGGAKISSEFLHHGEERELVPSHTIFFAGCNFRCVYCQNWDISQSPNSGEEISPEELAKTVTKRFDQGSKNLNLVGGDPTPNLLFILKLVKELEVPIPIVWNSNMYVTKSTISVLNEFVDLYLTDFKYGNNACGLRLSEVADYFDIVSRNHALINGDIIIRHLVLPNHSECCSKPILRWIADNLGTDIYVNIMAQYRPCYRADDFEDISSSLPNEQYHGVLDYAKELGFNV